MCGFVGLKIFERFDDPAGADIRRAVASIKHRGPDGEGVFSNEWLRLGHARLSIIDLSQAAAQPMLDDSERYAIVFNGEIYNYKELASKYLQDEPNINTASDTAVLLALYRKFGKACLDYLDGMFAFAITDLQERSIFLARDRFGEKPLYWTMDKAGFAFASELRALKSLLKDRDWQVSSESLAIYHVAGSIPAPKTIYSGVQALAPGRWLQISAAGEVEEGIFWTLHKSLAKNRRDTENLTLNQAIDGTRQKLLGSLNSRMVSDVPVGVFLSGGIDSGAILSLAAESGFSELNALCIDFPESEYSEYKLAKATADKFGAKLNRSVITPDLFIEHLGHFFESSDQPTTDGFNTYFVSMHAKALGIKVWLSGVGGDELFGGYPSFKRIGRLRLLSSMMQLVSPDVLSEKWATHKPKSLRASRLLHLGISGNPVTRAYQCLRNPMPLQNANNILMHEHGNEAMLTQCGLDKYYPDAAYFDDDFQSASALESGVYMASQLLRDIDNFSMAHSIETRAPFLDHNLFGYVFSLKESYKNSAVGTKSLLKKALPEPLPDEVMRQSKKGFTFPVEVWLKKNMQMSFEKYVFVENNAKFWDLIKVRELWNGYISGEVHWSTVWSFYAFARWNEANNG
jgi:asparagine synthase (glutamine-hydrolysing)